MSSTSWGTLFDSNREDDIAKPMRYLLLVLIISVSQIALNNDIAEDPSQAEVEPKSMSLLSVPTGCLGWGSTNINAPIFASTEFGYARFRTGLGALESERYIVIPKADAGDVLLARKWLVF